jgi:hypothetical protein
MYLNIKACSFLQQQNLDVYWRLDENFSSYKINFILASMKRNNAVQMAFQHL